MGDSRADLTAASGGSRPALEAILERHLPGLLAFVRLRMGPRLSARFGASDIVQSTCLEVLRDLADFEWRGEAAFRRWLYQAALHKILQRARGVRSARRNMEKEVALPRELTHVYASFCTASRAAIAREEAKRFEEAFSRLSDDHQRVILMARILGLSHREIGEELDRNDGAVRVLLHRALARLAVLLGDSTAPA